MVEHVWGQWSEDEDGADWHDLRSGEPIPSQARRIRLVTGDEPTVLIIHG